MKRRIIGGGLLLALVGTLIAAYRSDRLLFEIPTAATQRYFNKVGHALAKHHNLCFLMTFDETHPVEWIGRGAVNYPGTECVPGRIGQGRRFDGNSHTYMETSATWPMLGSNYTLSLWAKLESTGTDQEIWYNTFQGQLTGFKLCNGQLTFFVPGGQQEQAASYPFDAFGRLVNLVGVVDGSAGEARLYENGVLKATIPIAGVLHPNHNVEFGKTRWYAVTAPLRGTLEEAAAWTKALPPKEVRSLAHAHRSLPLVLEPLAYGRWRLMQAAQAAIPDTLRLLDRFNPLRHERRLSAANLPEIYLKFSSSDARHFIRAHNRSLVSGRRTANGAKPRRIDAQYSGHTVAAQIWLDGSDIQYPSSRRPGYILETPADAPAFGARLLRLTPPENLASGLPGIGAALARVGSSNTPSGLCRLMINGQFKGLYHFDSFDQRGLMPGERNWVAEGPKSQIDWPWIFHAAPPDNALAETEIAPAIRNAQINQARQLLANDIFFPWSSREGAWRIRKCQAVPDSQSEPLSPYAVLGNNPSPYYLIDDLDLQALALRSQPLDVVWQSSRPDVIDEKGNVTRPADDSPVGVKLTATIRQGETNLTQTLSFRVMPIDRKLPALMLYFDESLANCRRVDFLSRYYPAHDETPPRRLRGGQATRGGIKHRGNTSYWRGQKKPLSLRFDEPHHVMGPTDTRHLYLLNGYVDTPKMRNKLAFDLFRSFASESQPRYSPEIAWTEVFVNGVYFGVYEMCTRVDEYLVGFDQQPVATAPSAMLYMVSAPATLFAEVQTNSFIRVFPSALEQNQSREPIQELMAFTSQADPGKFAREIGDWIDLDNAIDFIILLNFVQNMDGRTTNFYLARAGGPGARFFFIPWDYDHIFAERNLWLSNFLFDRLRKEYPDFEVRLSRRWRELRQGVLSEAELDVRIQEMAKPLTGYMDWEYELLKYPVHPSFQYRVEELQQAVRANLANMDARLLPVTPAALSVP